MNDGRAGAQQRNKLITRRRRPWFGHRRCIRQSFQRVRGDRQIRLRGRSRHPQQQDRIGRRLGVAREHDLAVLLDHAICERTPGRSRRSEQTRP